MTRIEHYAAKRSVRWPALTLLAMLGLALLVAIGPLLMLGAGILLVVAWRAPDRLSSSLEHRWLARVPASLRATPHARGMQR